MDKLAFHMGLTMQNEQVGAYMQEISKYGIGCKNHKNVRNCTDYVHNHINLIARKNIGNKQKIPNSTRPEYKVINDR